MHYQYPIVPYIQPTMPNPIHNLMGSVPLPPNCFIIAIPMEQAQQIIPQIIRSTMTNTSNPPMFQTSPPPYYGQSYQTPIGHYENNLQAIPQPQMNYYPQVYNPNQNYPLVPYTEPKNKVNKRTHYGRNHPAQPHSNIYNSSSFDTEMESLSWSRLFGHHRHSYPLQLDHRAVAYQQKANSSKQQHLSGKKTALSSLSSSSNSDESIRRVSVTLQQPNGLVLPKQQIKGTLPFKYSSEFIPGNEKPKSQNLSKKETKLKPDDVFIIKKGPQATTQQ